MYKMIIVIVVSLMLISCSEEKPLNEATLKGRVSSGEISEVKFILSENNIAIEELEYYTEINDDSTFNISIPTPHSLSGTISYGNYWHRIFLLRGDDLHIYIEGDSIKYSGEGSKRNNFLYQQIEKTGINNLYELMRSKKGLAAVAKSAEEQYEKIIEKFEEYDDKLGFDPEFKKYFKLRIQAELEGFLLYYKMMYVFNNKIDTDTLKLPPEFQRLNNFNNFIDDSKLATREYFQSLNFLISAKAREFSSKFPDKKDSAVQIILFDSLKGKTKDFKTADYIKRQFEFNRYDTLLYNRFKSETTNSKAIEIVEASREKYIAKQDLIDQPLTAEFNQTLLEDDKGNELNFAEMIDKYKGKVIYLDIWSLGCGPCRSNMPLSKKLKENLRGAPIEFVYITTDSKIENLWEKVYEVSLSEKNHYRFVNGFDAKLLKFLEINWVPNYMLIDKDGKLISFQAVRPDSKNAEDKLKMYL